MTIILDRVLQIASETSGIAPGNLTDQMAVDQDLGMSGDDVADFVTELAKEFGNEVWQWPWRRFACLDEGVSPLFPLILLWQLFSWPFRGAFSYPSPYERLRLGHIAKVIEQGHWSEP